MTLISPWCILSGMVELPYRQELFVQYLLEGSTYIDAYEKAGYSVASKGAYSKASQLASNDKIKARVKELLEARSRAVTIDKYWLINEAVEVLNLAKHRNQLGTAIAAIREIGVLSGVRVEKSATTNENVHYIVSETQEQLEKDDGQTLDLDKIEGVYYIDGPAADN